MIPKIIHYCWLSDNPIPEVLDKYMMTWKLILPDYEFIKWDTKRFDISRSQWVKEAFENKKYAFAADFIRLYAVYHYGGIYLDSDVEVMKSFGDYLQLTTMIGWQQGRDGLEVAAFGASKGEKWVGMCLDYYKDRPFVKADGTFDLKTLPLIVEDVLATNRIELVNVKSLDEAKKIRGAAIPVFEADFFSPKGKDGVVRLTANTITIHHFAASWTGAFHRYIRKAVLMIGGERFRKIVSYIYRHFFYDIN